MGIAMKTYLICFFFTTKDYRNAHGEAQHTCAGLSPTELTQLRAKLFEEYKCKSLVFTFFVELTPDE